MLSNCFIAVAMLFVMHSASLNAGMMMEILPFTKPYSSSGSGCLRRAISNGSSTVPLLPDGRSYLDGEAANQREETCSSRSEGHTPELQSLTYFACRLLLYK